MAIYDDIIKEINAKYHTNYQLGENAGEGHFAKVFNLTGYKESPDDTHEYVGRFTLRPTTDDHWEWIKSKTRQEFTLLTRKDVDSKYVGKFAKTYIDDDKDPEWFFSIQKKLIPMNEYLRNILGKNPSKEKKELVYSKIFADLSEAMEYVHSLDYKNAKGILLRDVKPENIMYDKDVDRCLLCDFNTAREFNINDYWAGTTILAGTVNFMAPEIYLIKGGKERKPNPRQDVYSLGATIFSSLTRRDLKEPVTSTTDDEDTNDNDYRVQEISDDKKLDLLEKTGLSKAFQSIVFFSIHRVPQARYQTASELYLYTSLLYEKNKAVFENRTNKSQVTTLTAQVNNYKSQVTKLNEDLQKSKDQVSKSTATLKEKNRELRQTNKDLKAENERLARANTSLENENGKLLSRATMAEVLLEKEKEEKKNTEKLSEKKKSTETIEDFMEFLKDASDEDNRSEKQRLIDEFLARFEDPADELSADISAYLNDLKQKDNRSEAEKEIDDFLNRTGGRDNELEQALTFKYVDDKHKTNETKQTKKSQTQNSKTKKSQAQTKKSDTQTKKPAKKKEELEEKAYLYAAGLVINCIWIIAYLILNYMTTLDALFEKYTAGNLAFALAVIMLMPIGHAECFAFPENFEDRTDFIGTFSRLTLELFISFMLLNLHNCLIPKTFISYTVIFNIFWSLLIICITIQYYKYLRTTRLTMALCQIIISFGLVLIMLLSVGVIARHNSYSIGDEIALGRYTQSSEAYAKEETLTWRVCGVIDDNLLVATDKCIDYLPLSSQNEQDIRWKDTALRFWLNNVFYDDVFTKEEKDTIQQANLSTSLVSPSAFKQSGIEYTDNYVFIDDVQHANYLRSNPGITDYAKAKYEKDNERKEYPYIWTRSNNSTDSETDSTYFWVTQTETDKNAAFIQHSEDKAFVRPMMYISIKAYNKYIKGETDE